MPKQGINKIYKSNITSVIYKNTEKNVKLK